MRLLPILLVALFAVSCPKDAPQNPAATPRVGQQSKSAATAPAQPYAGTVTAWADPLLMTPLEGIGADLEKWYGIKLELTAVDSGELLELVSAGKPGKLPDLFLIGHPDLFETLRNAGWVDEQGARTFAGDRVAIVQKRNNGYLVKGELFDLYKLYFNTFGLGENETTAGYYGYQALFTSGLHKRIEERLVMLPTTDSIVEALMTGEVPLAAMAASSATQAEELEVLRLVDETYHEDIRYLAVPVSGKPSTPALTELLRQLAEDPGVQHALVGYGLVGREIAMVENK